LGGEWALRYQKVKWHHEFAEEPVVLYSEIDGDGMEARKVEEYRDGRLDLADATTQTGSTGLGEVPLPSLEEINAQPEFTGEAIGEEEFEQVWSRAWKWFEDDGDLTEPASSQRGPEPRAERSDDGGGNGSES
jgi:hypothetical protein